MTKIKKSEQNYKKYGTIKRKKIKSNERNIKMKIRKMRYKKKMKSEK